MTVNSVLMYREDPPLPQPGPFAAQLWKKLFVAAETTVNTERNGSVCVGRVRVDIGEFSFSVPRGLKVAHNRRTPDSQCLYHELTDTSSSCVKLTRASKRQR